MPEDMIDSLKAKELEAEAARSPKLKAAYDAAVSAQEAAETAQEAAETAQEAAETALAALKTAAGALVTAMEADGATLAGCAEPLAALKALLV